MYIDQRAIPVVWSERVNEIWSLLTQFSSWRCSKYRFLMHKLKIDIVLWNVVRTSLDIFSGAKPLPYPLRFVTIFNPQPLTMPLQIKKYKVVAKNKIRIVLDKTINFANFATSDKKVQNWDLKLHIMKVSWKWSEEPV